MITKKEIAKMSNFYLQKTKRKFKQTKEVKAIKFLAEKKFPEKLANKIRHNSI